MVSNIFLGISNLFASLDNFRFINRGRALGIVFGAIPGLSATMGVALLLPITFGMEPVPGILLLLGIYCGGCYGGSISAILIKTPGTPAAAATVLDGYPLTQQGHAGKALQMAVIASTFGGIISTIMLLFLAPAIAKFAIKFGPAEFFALSLFGLSIIANVSGKSLFKGIIAGCIGMFFGMVGLDPIEIVPRLTFGSLQLAAGINIVPALIGLFAVSEILNKIHSGEFQNKAKLDFIKEKVTWSETKASLGTFIKSGIIGTFIGAVPGTGAATASFISYNEAKRVSKTPEVFGTGCLDGIAAAESGNNGVTGATLIPLLTLGIPGDTVTAIMLGALTMQGLTPGPNLFQNQAAIVYTIIIGLFFVNIFMFIQASVFIKGFVNITRIPTNFLLPILIVLCYIGGFSIKNSVFDCYLIMAFALLGYIIGKMKLPVTPMLLGIILEPIAENGMRQAMIMSGGSISIFFTRPISCVFIIITVCSVAFTIYKEYFRKDKGSSKVG